MRRLLRARGSDPPAAWARAPAAIVAATLAFLLAGGVAWSKPSLRLQVDEGSGRIALGGLRGGLVEAEGGGPGPGGRIGFATAARWYHAEGIESLGEGRARSQRLLLRTDDPAGRLIELTVRTGAGARARLVARVVGGDTSDVESVGIGFAAAGSERYLGFGERSNAVDQRGNTVESYVGEGPYLPAEYPIIKAIVPEWGIRERPDATYFPMPWLLSTRGFGILLNNLETSRFRLGSARAGEWSVEADAARISVTVLAGPEPADVLRRLTRLTGRQPRAPAPWLFGPWFQTGHSNTEPDESDHVAVLRRADAPISAVETHMRYMPCGSDQGQAAVERARTRGFHRQGLAALTYTREAICETYAAPFDAAVAADAFLETGAGEPFTFTAFVGGGVTDVGMLDFSDPDAQPIYASILDRAYDNGYDGWMEDYGEYAPPDSTAENGMRGRRMHNLYPVLYHRAGQRYAESKRRPVVRFTRSGFTGVHPHTPIVWGGDPTTGWDFDGLRSSVVQALTMGLSGISSWGSDVGGFFTFSDQTLDRELLARWIQFGAVSGVMRTKAQGIPTPKSSRPQIWERPTLAVWRRYAKLRTQLYPYLRAAERRYRRSGRPIMAHLALAFPGDPRAAASESEFMFGPDLLAAPVLDPGERERSLHLPPGRWVDFWSAVRYRGRDGRLILRRAAVIRGGRRVRVDAPLPELPLLARAGTLLPLLPEDVDTLADYGRRGLVRLADRRRDLRLLALPRGRSAAGFHGDGRVRSREGGRSWVLDLRSRRRLDVELEAAMSTLRRPFTPAVVRQDGRRIDTWRYNPRTRVLSVRFSGRRSRLVVR